MNNASITDCKTASTERIHAVAKNELLGDNELACPPLGACLWNSHPRVFLKLDDAGKAHCPYCGTTYRIA